MAYLTQTGSSVWNTKPDPMTEALFAAINEGRMFSMLPDKWLNKIVKYNWN